MISIEAVRPSSIRKRRERRLLLSDSDGQSAEHHQRTKDYLSFHMMLLRIATVTDRNIGGRRRLRKSKEDCRRSENGNRLLFVVQRNLTSEVERFGLPYVETDGIQTVVKGREERPRTDHGQNRSL